MWTRSRTDCSEGVWVEGRRRQQWTLHGALCFLPCGSPGLLLVAELEDFARISLQYHPINRVPPLFLLILFSSLLFPVTRHAFGVCVLSAHHRGADRSSLPTRHLLLAHSASVSSGTRNLTPSYDRIIPSAGCMYPSPTSDEPNGIRCGINLFVS